MTETNTPKNNPKKIAELEALLFYYGEPIEVKKLAKLLAVNESECESLLASLEESLKEETRGLTVIKQGKEVQLVTKPELRYINERLIREEFREELTPAALEALSIVAYLGPIPRSTIDYIRGVNSSFTLRGLLIRGLINREIDPERRNVYLYQASFDFLKHLGLQGIKELPEYEKYKNILTRFETQNPTQTL